MGRLLWDETVHSLCSRSPHGETVVARRAQLREDRLIPLFLEWGEEKGSFDGRSGGNHSAHDLGSRGEDSQRAASEGPC